MKPRTARKGIIAAIAAAILSATLPALALPQDSGTPGGSNVVDDSDVYAVPEPASTMLAVCLGACFLLRRPMRGAFPKTLEQDETFSTQ